MTDAEREAELRAWAVASMEGKLVELGCSEWGDAAQTVLDATAAECAALLVAFEVEP